jgi:N-acetylglucosamine-6-sulfatase
VDIPPTIMQLAGLAPAERWDGRSFAGLLAPDLFGGGGGDPAAWPRQEYLVAYMACSQPPKISPNDHGHAKDVGNNTFIGLRIINETANLAYFEFTDAYKDWGFEAVDFYELYDTAADPHQLRNLYYRGPSPSAAVKHELHERLHRAWACRGADCF